MKTYSIGRDPGCDIVINDTTDVISRRHAILNINPSGKMTIVDQSTNGTYINGIRISPNAPVPVTRKDTVSFAHVSKLDWRLIPSNNKILWIVIIAIVSTIILGCGGFLIISKLIEDKPITDNTVLIAEDNSSTFTTSTSEIKCLAEGGEYKVQFESNNTDRVFAKSNVEWITSIVVNEREIVFNVNSNDSNESRYAKLTITYGEDKSVDISVIQVGQVTFVINSSNDITLSSSATKEQILFTIVNRVDNVNVTAKVVGENTEWITLGNVDNNKVQYSVTKNTSDKKREAKIILTYGDKEQIVTIRQKPGKNVSTKPDQTQPKESITEKDQTEDKKPVIHIG